VALFLFITTLFLSIYENSLWVIQYYSPNNIDSHRVTFSSKGTVFDIFSKNAWGIDQALSYEIEKDSRFSRVRKFRFVDTNILGGFDIFTFHFDTDIPVFTLEDSLSDMWGFGISPAMMHYYNLELAGSHPMFPPLDEQFLRWKNVTLTFGASKIFSVSTQAASPLRGTIVSIDSDYPGFGIVAPKKLVDEKLSEIGISAKQPYKIIAYMNDIGSRDEIVEKYSRLNLKFDSDIQKEYKRKLHVLDLTLFGTWMFFLGIITFLMVMLFLWYFRERKDVFRLVDVYGISAHYKYILLYGEMTLLIAIALIGSLLSIYFFQYSFLARAQQFFIDHGVLFSIVRLSPLYIGKIFIAWLITILWVTLLTSRK
jgi:hypothetical protein